MTRILYETLYRLAAFLLGLTVLASCNGLFPRGRATAVHNCLKEIFDSMPSFKKDAAKGLNATYQFDLSGDGGGQWHAIIANEQCEVKAGKAASPNITISMTAQDYLDMVNGKLNGQMAFMPGKLRIAGDMGLWLRLKSLFREVATNSCSRL
jgi:putative sterol carrier protein